MMDIIRELCNVLEMPCLSRIAVSIGISCVDKWEPFFSKYRKLSSFHKVTEMIDCKIDCEQLSIEGDLPDGLRFLKKIAIGSVLLY